jgi:ATP-dependent RNA helicase DDX24/MAK5
MIQQGSFPQLTQILEAVRRANPSDDSDESDGSDDDDEASSDERMHALPGIPGEAKVTMLSEEILKQFEMTARESCDEAVSLVENSEDTERDLPGNDDTADEENDDTKEDPYATSIELEDDAIALPSRPPVKRQTFVYSATLTLPASSSSRQSKDTKKRRHSETTDGAIGEILEKAHALGVTKVVDLTNATLSKSQALCSNFGRGIVPGEDDCRPKKSAATKSSQMQIRLPDGIKFQEIKCTQRHKDSYLYAYLMTTIAGSAGPALIFCNSIAAVRRVGATLQTLGLPVRILHAQMQQVRCCKKTHSHLFDNKNQANEQESMNFLCNEEESTTKRLNRKSIGQKDVVIHHGAYVNNL